MTPSALSALYIVAAVYFLLLIYSTYVKPKMQKRRTRVKQTERRNARVSIQSARKPTLVEYPNYNLSHAVASHHPPHYKIERYSYEDLKAKVVDRDVEFFKALAAAKRASYEAKLAIYGDMADKASSELASMPDGHLNEHSERMNKNKRLLARCELICDHIIATMDSLTEENMFRDYRSLIWDKERGFDNIVGRKDVKDAIAQEIFAFVRDPKISYTGFQNRLITGPPGCGKTKLAACIAHAYSKSGIIVLNRFKVLSKSDFTSQFVGGTSIKVTELFVESLEEIMIGDEMYALFRRGGMRDYGEDAIDGIVHHTDEYRGLSRLFALGYEDNIVANFIGGNDGMNRRFPQKLRISLKPYDRRELAIILIRYIVDMTEFHISEYVASAIYKMIRDSDDAVFSQQASSMVDIAEFIVSSIKGAKNLTWRDDDDAGNATTIEVCYAEYLKVGGH